MITDDFIGQGSGFNWFTGVVEDRQDPEKLGRVRVRIVGIHSPKRVGDDVTGDGIAVENLPWAYPMQPLTSAAMNGIGETPLGPVEGSWIVGFSRDGELYQDLIIMGTLGGIPQETARNEGFWDPNQVYPKATHIKEADTNRLARNEKIEETIVQTKKDGVDKSVPRAGGGTWSEPETPYAAEYPFNHVKETESGHIVEFDDTEGAERIHEYHKSGTFKEVHPEGTIVHKVVKDRYEIVIGDDFVHVSGNVSITVEKDAEIYVKGNATTKIDGNRIENVKGDVTQTIYGNFSQTIKGSSTKTVTGSQTDKASSYDITGPQKQTGKVTQSGGISSDANINTSADVKAGSVSLKDHKHTGVTPGAALTGPPSPV